MKNCNSSAGSEYKVGFKYAQCGERTSMKHQKEKKGAMLHQLLDIGEALLANGAEVGRVEDTLTRMGMAYGAVRMNVFVITSSVVVTMTFPDGTEWTQTRRIFNPGGTDFTKLEALNALSRRFCEKTMSAEELHEELVKLDRKNLRRRSLYLGSMLAAGSFAIFFGGNLQDGVMAAVFAVLICYLQETITPICPNRVTFNLLASFFSGLGICACARIMPFLHADKIMIGDIMLLIPGIAMTNSIRNILVGNTISGIMRLIESLLWAGALACGYMTAICFFGG